MVTEMIGDDRKREKKKTLRKAGEGKKKKCNKGGRRAKKGKALEKKKFF